MSSGQTSLEQMLGVYKWVVDDVMKNVREDFLNEGADTQVLEDLKQLWENKLVQSGALSRPMKPEAAHPIKETISQDKQNKSSQQQQQHSQQSTSSTPTITHSSPASNTPAASVIQQAPPRPSLSSAMTTPTASSGPGVSFTPPLNSSSRSSGGTGGVSQATPSQTPPQITGVGATNTQPFLNMALAQQALYSAITGGAANPVGGAGATLPVVLPSGGLSLVQHGGIPYAAVPTPTGLQYVPIALNLPGTIAPNTSSETSSSNNITQADGPRPLVPPHDKQSSKETKGLESNEAPSTEDSSLPVILFELPAGITPSHFFSSSSKRKSRSVSRRTGTTKDSATTIPQLDGPPPPPDGSSSEDSDESSESDPDDIEGEQDDDEEPLNSNDDAESDEEDDVWETDNTIVCQFEKVYRVRAKWKFALKDGIMHLNGHDYIFTKTAGEAEW